MSYRPREFWEQVLTQHPGLRGTGQPGMSSAYNDACYALRREVLDRALREAGFDPRGRGVLDVGSGRGFFTAYYLQRGARVTGIDITSASVTDLSARFPDARFILGDVSEVALDQRWDLVNAFDVLYHRMRPLERYRAILEPAGLTLGARYPTHVLLNSDLGLLRFVNRVPWLLLPLDRALLALGAGRDRRHNQLLVARRRASSARG